MEKETKSSIISVQLGTIRKEFVNDVRSIIESARESAVRSVDTCRVKMYWEIGCRIFEEEQLGKERADYGTYLIKNLSKTIMPEYGSGFGDVNWKEVVNFIGYIQLRPHCGRN